MLWTQSELEQMAESVPFWWHSIDLGEAVVTKGARTPSFLMAHLAALRLPRLHGKVVLDIGAWDGFYSFEAERRGAARVVALDHYVWSLDLPAQQRYWQECRERGILPQPYHSVPGLWQPFELPGKRGFDVAHMALASRVECVVADFMEMDLEQIGTFDVVLYLGVLYHMENPFAALKRVAAVTRELAVIETAAAAVPGFEAYALCQFFETNEYGHDVSNWWAPNRRALEGLCRASGFKRVDILVGPEDAGMLPAGEVSIYRTIAHAWK